MFSKPQRQALGKICAELYGVETTWQKLMKDNRFRVVTEVVEKPMTHFSDGKKIVTIVNAKADGRLPRDFEAPKVPSTVSREPNYEELMKLLTAQLVEAKLEFMDDDQQLKVLGYLFSKKRHPRTPLIQVVDPADVDFRKTIDGLADLLPAEYGDFLKRMTSSTSKHGFDAVSFANHLVFCFQHEADAEKIAAGIIAAVDLAIPRKIAGQIRLRAELMNAR